MQDDRVNMTTPLEKSNAIVIYANGAYESLIAKAQPLVTSWSTHLTDKELPQFWQDTQIQLNKYVEDIHQLFAILTTITGFQTRIHRIMEDESTRNKPLQCNVALKFMQESEVKFSTLLGELQNQTTTYTNLLNIEEFKNKEQTLNARPPPP